MQRRSESDGRDWWERVPRETWAATVRDEQPKLHARTTQKVSHLLVGLELYRLQALDGALGIGAPSFSDD